MVLEDKKAIVREYYEQMLNRKELAFADQYLTSTFSFRDPSNFSQVFDREGLKRYVLDLHSAFPNIKFTIMDIIAEDNKVMVDWVATGTQDGTFSGIAPTRKQVKVTGMSLFSFRDSKIEVIKLQVDWLGLLKQFGLKAIPELVQL